MNGFLKVFMKESLVNQLPLDMRKKIPYLVTTSLLLVGFFLFSGTAKYLENPQAHGIFGLAVYTTSTSFVTALILIRRDRFFLASFLTSLGLFLNVQWLGFLLPPSHPLELYRYETFAFGSVIVVHLMAFQSWVPIFYGIGSTLGLVILALGIYPPLLGGMTKELSNT